MVKQEKLKRLKYNDMLKEQMRQHEMEKKRQEKMDDREYQLNLKKYHNLLPMRQGIDKHVNIVSLKLIENT